MTKSSSSKVTARSPFSEALAGLAADYWHDGPTPAFWVSFKDEVGEKIKDLLAPKSKETKKISSAELSRRRALEREQRRLWVGSRVDVVEAMWGEGFCLPGENRYCDMMALPLGLTKVANVLDLAAGFGALGRHLAENMNIYVTGLEPDAELAKHGMDLSRVRDLAVQVPVVAYDPSAFLADKRYHCILARELFYRVAKKDVFLTEVCKSFFPDNNPRGQLAFTDYVLEPSDLAKPAIKAWLAFEKEAKPMTLDLMSKLLSKHRLDVRVKEDLTEDYRKEVLRGFARLAIFLGVHPPSSTTKAIVLKEMQLWGLRVAAMKQGLKLYRFYAIKT